MMVTQTVLNRSRALRLLALHVLAGLALFVSCIALGSAGVALPRSRRMIA
jgi:hypothetical protein